MYVASRLITLSLCQHSNQTCRCPYQQQSERSSILWTGLFRPEWLWPNLESRKYSARKNGWRYLALYEYFVYNLLVNLLFFTIIYIYSRCIYSPTVEITYVKWKFRFQVTILGIFQNTGHYKSENWLNSYKLLNIKEYPLDFLAALV